jgi:hypothetical protein
MANLLEQAIECSTENTRPVTPNGWKPSACGKGVHQSGRRERHGRRLSLQLGNVLSGIR